MKLKGQKYTTTWPKGRVWPVNIMKHKYKAAFPIGAKSKASKSRKKKEQKKKKGEEEDCCLRKP